MRAWVQGWEHESLGARLGAWEPGCKAGNMRALVQGLEHESLGARIGTWEPWCKHWNMRGLVQALEHESLGARAGSMRMWLSGLVCEKGIRLGTKRGQVWGWGCDQEPGCQTGGLGMSVITWVQGWGMTAELGVRLGWEPGYETRSMRVWMYIPKPSASRKEG